MSGKGQTLLEMKLRAQAREADEKAKAARKRNMLVLVLDFLCKSGYTDSLDRLQSESSLSLSKWVAADNLDLATVFQEFEAFYEMKYQRPPRMVRPATAEDQDEAEKALARARRKAVPLPSLPSGMGSTPSALPAHYRSSHAAQDGYQGNGLDMATNMTYSSGSSIEQQQGAAPGAPKQERGGSAAPTGAARIRSAKGSKAEKIAAAIAAGNAGIAAEAASAAPAASSQSGRQPSAAQSSSSSKEHRASRSHKPASSMEFSVQGSNSTSAAAASAAATNAAAAPAPSPSPPPKSKRALAPSPGRSESPDAEEFGGAGGADDKGTDHASFFETRLLKPLPEYADAQFRELAHVITRDIFSSNPNVRWSDIAELEEAKQLLQEAVVMPLRFPQFFTGLLSPWKGVLLYGPPGTGKTMLARAVATECRTTFFNISASSIVSKYRGDSEKLVRVLFELARYHAPSTIFIDEVDAIMGRRDAAGEHEGSRRMKTELLVQMDGLSKSDDLVFVLAASNMPWDLDIALLRRLEKRILVPLPNERARALMLRGHLTDNWPEGRAQGLDYGDLARRTEGYSGSDISLLCKEAAMRPVRRLMKQLLAVPAANSAAAQASQAELAEEVRLDPVTPMDVRDALACTRPSAQSKFLEKYAQWHAEYGAGLVDVALEAQDGDA